MAEQEGEPVIDPTFPVMQVGVTYAAGLNPHDRLARTRVWDQDCRHFDRCPFFAGDDALNRLNHLVLPFVTRERRLSWSMINVRGPDLVLENAASVAKTPMRQGADTRRRLTR